MKFKGLTLENTIEQAFSFYYLTKSSLNLSKATLNGLSCFYNMLVKFFESGGDGKDTKLNVWKGGAIVDALFVEYLDSHGYATTTKAVAMVQYNAFYRYLSEDLDLLPVRKLTVKKAERPIKNLLTEEQLRLLLTPPKNLRDFYLYENYVIAHFTLNTGCRARNISELRLDDLSRLDEGIVRFATTKNRKPQLIFVPSGTVSVVKKWLNVWRSDAAASDFVFCDNKGAQMDAKHIGYNYARYVVKRLGKGAPTSIHLLRHQYAFTYLQKGGSIYDLKRQLGHSSFNMVQWYADHTVEPNISNMERFTPSFNLEPSSRLRPNLGKKKKGEDD